MSRAMFRLAKIFLYLIPLSVLIVPSTMFFPFIVGKAIFLRTTVSLALLFFLSYILFKPEKSDLEDFFKTIKQPLFIAIGVFTLVFLLSSFTAVNSQIAFWSNFERGEGALQMIHYGLLFMLAALILKTKEDWKKYFLWLLGISTLVSLFGIGQYLNYLNASNPQNPWTSFIGASTRISGTLGNPLYLSTFNFFIFFFAAFLFSETKKAGAKIFYGLILLFQLLVFLMTDSRNGYVGLAGGILAMLIYFILSGKGLPLKKITLQKFSLVLSGALVLVFAFLFINNRNILYGLLSLFNFQTTLNIINALAVLVFLGFLLYASLGTRGQSKEKLSLRQISTIIFTICLLLGGFFLANRSADVWKEIPALRRFSHEKLLTGLDDRVWTWGSAVAGFIEKPLLGWGPENFPYAFDKYYDARHYGLDSWFDRAHNIYLEYLTSGGSILFLAYILIWAAYFFTLRKTLKKESPNNQSFQNIFLKGLLIGLPVAYFIQGLTAFEVLPIYVVFYSFLAFSLRLQIFEQEPKEIHRSKKMTEYVRPLPLLFSIIVLTSATAIFAVSFYFANYLTYRKNTMLLAAATSREKPQAVFDAFEKTLGFYSPIGQQETVQHYTWFLLRFFESVSANPSYKNTPQNSAAIKALLSRANDVYRGNENSASREVGTRTLSYNGLVNLKVALITNDTAALEEAEKKFNEGLALAPTRFEFLYPLLDIAIAKKDAIKAKTLLGRAKFLRPDLARNKAYEEAVKTLTPAD